MTIPCYVVNANKERDFLGLPALLRVTLCGYLTGENFTETSFIIRHSYVHVPDCILHH